MHTLSHGVPGGSVKGRIANLRQFLEFSAQAAQDAGLALAQHQALLGIKGMPGPVAVGTLAVWLGIRHRSAVGLVDRLAKGTLVTRILGPNDRRRMRLKLTPRADAKLAALSQVHREIAPLLHRAGAAFGCTSLGIL